MTKPHPAAAPVHKWATNVNILKNIANPSQVHLHSLVVPPMLAKAGWGGLRPLEFDAHVGMGSAASSLIKLSDI